MSDNIFLIGMMGSGKSTTARELAAIRGLRFVDLDACIEESRGKSINQIFSEDGERFFRELEKRSLNGALKQSSQVVATGGGVVLDRSNVDAMRGSGKVVYLKTDFSVLWERVKDSKTRPLLKADSPQALFRALFDARTPLYEQACHYSVLTDRKTPREVAVDIDRLLN